MNYIFLTLFKGELSGFLSLNEEIQQINFSSLNHISFHPLFHCLLFKPTQNNLHIQSLPLDNILQLSFIQLLLFLYQCIRHIKFRSITYLQLLQKNNVNNEYYKSFYFFFIFFCFLLIKLLMQLSISLSMMLVLCH